MKEKLKEILLVQYDPDDLVDILNISSDEILDRFTDKFTLELYQEYCGIEDPLPHNVVELEL